MNNTMVAKYFDGKSSATQQTSIIFNEITRELHFQTSAGSSVVWKIDDLIIEQYGNFIDVRNQNNPGELIKIDPNDVSDRFNDIIKQKKKIDIHTRLMNLGMKKITVIAVLLLGVIVLAYFFVLPPVAERSVALLPESVDDEIGNAFMSTFLDENEIDATKTKYLEQFAAELQLKNKKPLHFMVVKSNEVNAFALPNGQIVVYSAILKKMKSSDELVALIGHEASHVNGRHSTKMLCRNLAGYMLVSLLFSDVNGIMAVLAENAHQLHSLSYSRSFEEEADEQGLKLLMDNKVNPEGMIKLFEQLERESKISVPQIISTHPLTIERKKNMKSIISNTVYEVAPNEKLDAIFKNIKQ